MGIVNRLAKAFRRKPPAPPPSIRVTQDGLDILREDDVLASVRWSDVKKIIAYKYDLFATDEICIGFLASSDAASWPEINEQWSGFREAATKMEAIFPSIPKDWYVEIMVPALECKETVLWEGS